MGQSRSRGLHVRSSTIFGRSKRRTQSPLRGLDSTGWQQSAKSCLCIPVFRIEVSMLFGIQFAIASLLIAAGSSVVLLWLSSLTLAYSSQTSLMPWTDAGVILFGLLFVAIGAFIGIPGIVWANNLARNVSPKWQRLAKAPGWIGKATLVLGFATAIGVLVISLGRGQT
jgi:hypothetical protein